MARSSDRPVGRAAQCSQATATHSVMTSVGPSGRLSAAAHDAPRDARRRRYECHLEPAPQGQLRRAKQREGAPSRASFTSRDSRPQVEQFELAAVRAQRRGEHRPLLLPHPRVRPCLLERRQLAEQQVSALRGQARLPQPVEG